MKKSLNLLKDSELSKLKLKNRKVTVAKKYFNRKKVLSLVSPSEYLKENGFEELEKYEIDKFYRFLSYLEVSYEKKLSSKLIDKDILDFYIDYNGIPIRNGFNQKQLDEIEKAYEKRGVQCKKNYTCEDLWIEICVRENNRNLGTKKLYIKVWEHINMSYYYYLIQL